MKQPRQSSQAALDPSFRLEVSASAPEPVLPAECAFSVPLTESNAATAQEEERERISLKHASTPPIGEPGVLSHPQTLFHIGSHAQLRILFGFFGIEECAFRHTHDHTPTAQPHRQPHTAHSTSVASAAETQDNAEHNSALTTEPPTGATTVAGGRPSHPPPPRSCPKVRAPWTGPAKSLNTTSPAALCHTGGYS